MNEVICKLYKFSELSEDVKMKLVEKYRYDIMSSAMNVYNSDWRKSLSEFEKLTNTTLKNWEVDYCGCYYGRILFNSDVPLLGNYDYPLYADDIQGKLLFRYIENNILWRISNKKVYGGEYRYYAKKLKSFKKKRISKILYENYDECALTGFCGDYMLLKPIIDYCRNWNKYPDMTLTDLYEKCYYGFLQDWQNEYVGCASDEFVMEELEYNDESRLYFEDGTIFRHKELCEIY